jgi:hypothetical protein
MIAQPEIAMEVTPDYVIIVPQDASQTEEYAARELSDYVFKINGVRLSVETDDAPASEKEICVGDTNRLRDGAEDLQNDGYQLLVQDDRLYIRGENDRGVLYGVYGLLEDVLGCRFYASMVEKVPQRSRILIPDDLNVSRSPVFEFRDTNWVAAESADYAAKRGLNGYFSRLTAKEGGAIRYGGEFVHTFDEYVPVNEFYEDHPEYFSMVNGKRIKEQTQLCLTNPEVLEIVIDRVKAAIKSNPDATIFSISQNDWYNPCTCPECAKVDEEEGSHAGTLIRFINKVAEAVEEEYPDVIIDTLAYQYTRVPPKITKPRANVAIRFCTIEACFSHPLSSCTAVSKTFKDLVGTRTLQQDLKGWSKICDRIYVWDYTTDFAHYLMTFPNLYILGENMQYFAQNHVVGLFEQGNGESVSGEFGELRAYLISKLMWNPQGDYKAYIRDFLKGYYGDAAGPIGEYLDMVCTWVQENNVHVSIYDPPSISYMPEEMLQKGEALWARAVELAEGDVKLTARVKKSSLQIRYIRLFRMSPVDPDRAALRAEFVKDINRFQITRLKEWVPLEDSLKALGK